MDAMNTRQKVVEAFYRLAGNIHAVARELGLDRKTVKYHLDKEGLRGKTIASGEVEYSEPKKMPTRRSGRKLLLTCAQNNTHVHGPFLDNLEAYAEHIGAEIMVSKTTYNTTGFHNPEEVWYDPRVVGYLQDHNVEVAPGLVFCAEINIIPTAVRPLSGFETFTGEKSAIFGHTKVAMESIPTAKDDPAKFNYTTGTCTLRNYVKAKAGARASFHHAYAALIVEVDSKGAWWVRQLVADEDGSFHDLNLEIRDGEVHDGSVAAIVWGDIHAQQADPDVIALAFDDGGILDQLQPGVQVMHDLLDFRARNHHERSNPHATFRLHVEGTDDVGEEILRTGSLLWKTHRDFCATVVAPSNHDDALTRWLREADYREDPKNALLFLRLQLAVYEAIQSGDEDFHLLEYALRGLHFGDCKFLHTDESFVVEDIEVGMHGHIGANGSRGNPRQFTRSGKKSVTGHTHSACIVDGAWVVGTFSRLDLGYNKGPSSWSHSLVLIYPGGKRSLITVRDGKWRA